MAIKEEWIECDACSGTGVCSKCLSTGGYFDEDLGRYEDCTLCDWESVGECWKCRGLKGVTEYSTVDDGIEINLDFRLDNDEEFDVAL